MNKEQAIQAMLQGKRIINPIYTNMSGCLYAEYKDHMFRSNNDIGFNVNKMPLEGWSILNPIISYKEAIKYILMGCVVECDWNHITYIRDGNSIVLKESDSRMCVYSGMVTSNWRVV